MHLRARSGTLTGMRRVALASAVMASSLVVGALVMVACTTDYQKGADDPNFGGPNALAGQKQPGATTEVLTTPAAGGEGGAAASTIVCVATGGTMIDAGPCPVSFKNDVLPVFGRSTCIQTSCHGGATPPSPPRIEPSDAPGMWQLFASYKMNAGNLPYINPCEKDKTKAGIACNLYAQGFCGVQMPLGGTPPTPQADIDKIEQWLACGSPNN
jgi:hypothetical protein